MKRIALLILTNIAIVVMLGIVLNVVSLLTGINFGQMAGKSLNITSLLVFAFVVGFAGSVADAFTLCEKFEEMLQKYAGNLMRSAVELAQLWRSDKIMRKLEAMMIVANSDEMFLVDGTGNVIEPEDGICAIGSGGNYALSAARALMKHTNMTAREIAEESIKVAGEICIFTNDHITVEEV